MFEVNKYEVELAIDQYKIRNGENITFSETGEGVNYGNQIFASREQAIWWIKNQSFNVDKIRKEINADRKRAKLSGEIAGLEDLYKVFDLYYEKELLVRKEVSRGLHDLKKTVIDKYSKQVPNIEIPNIDPLGLYDDYGIEYFTIGKDSLEVFYNKTEKILPLTDPTLERHEYSFEDMGLFLKQSINSLTGKDISLEVAEKIASRIVRIETENGSGTGFIMDGKIVTNEHVVRGSNWVRIFNLQGDEIIDFNYTRPREAPTYSSYINGRDIFYMELGDSIKGQYEGVINLGITDGLIFGTKPIHRSISKGKEGQFIGLWIEKVEVNPDPKNPAKIIFGEGANNVKGTSGSIVFSGGNPVGLNSFGESFTESRRSLLGIDIGRISGTQKSMTNKGNGKSGGYYFN